jgi:hypothetical protein
MTPSWLLLLAPLPETAAIERAPVASPALVAAGRADAIAGWESLSVHLSAPDAGLRHVLVTLDAAGKVLSAGDHVMRQRRERRDGAAIDVYDHESIGGRYADDGSFQGTRWVSRAEQRAESDEVASSESTPSTPSAADVDALNAIVADVLRRAPARSA